MASLGPSAAVVDRRNKPIQDAVDRQNWKLALQLCDKRIKKGENSNFIIVIMAN